MRKIETRRAPADLRKCTLCGYKKADVFRSLTKSLRDGDLPGAQRWAAEMVGSHLTSWMINKLITAWFPAEIDVSKVPTSPAMVYRLLQRAKALEARLGADHMADSAEVRFLVARIVGLLSLWPKRTFRLPKIQTDDFRPEKMQGRCISKDSNWAQQIMLPGDPLELAIPINELAHHTLRQRFRSVQQAQPQYWLQWYLEWIRWRETSDPHGAGITTRDTSIPCGDDPVWLVWDLFEKLGNAVSDSEAARQIGILRKLFEHEYRKSKRTERKFLLAIALELLANPADWSQGCFSTGNWGIMLSAEASVGWVYQSLAEKAVEWEKEHSILMPKTPALSAMPLRGIHIGKTVTQPSHRNSAPPPPVVIRPPSPKHVLPTVRQDFQRERTVTFGLPTASEDQASFSLRADLLPRRKEKIILAPGQLEPKTDLTEEEDEPSLTIEIASDAPPTTHNPMSRTETS